jgi:hypothetical protein
MVALYVSSLEEIQLIQLQTATFTTKDGRQFDGARVSLETDGLRVAARTGWVTIPLDELPDDLSVFPDDLREQISRRRLAAANDEKPSSLLTFTTRSGHDYRQVRWALHDGGLAVLTDDGWISIPFAELPEDLSAFPPEVRTALAAKHDAPALDGATATLVSFETKSKKVYDEVRASVSDRGLSVLTANGWVTVPFTDLPSDLSPFPESWRNEISEGRDKAELTEMQWVSFTTRKGKAYDDVRALLLVDGLSVTTPEGIVRISFNQLPDDLSPFPASWRSVINQRRSAAGNLPASPVADKATAETSTPR